MLAACALVLNLGNTRRKSPSETLIPRLSYIAPLKDIAGVTQVLQDSFLSLYKLFLGTSWKRSSIYPRRAHVCLVLKKHLLVKEI